MAHMVTVSPRARILAKASELFYQEGIHAVGIDRLVTEADVTRRTFYRYFPSKDSLVVEYLNATDATLRAAVDTRATAASNGAAVLAVLDLIGSTVCSPGFRGCHFINAAAEFPDPGHPVRQAIKAHRDWFYDRLVELSDSAGHRDPRHAAAVCVLIHDGALSAGELDDPAAVSATVRRAVRELFA